MSYTKLTFKDLNEKRKENVRAKIESLHELGYEPREIARKVRIGHRSVATAIGNITRKE